MAEGAEVKIGDVVATIEEGKADGAETKAKPPEKKTETAKAGPQKEPVLSPSARRIVTDEVCPMTRPPVLEYRFRPE